MNWCNDPAKSCSGDTPKETPMSGAIDDEIKRWTARRKATLVLEVIQGKTTLAEANRAFDLL